jgi:hypothetical protein
VVTEEQFRIARDYVRWTLTRSGLVVCSALALGHICFYFYDVSQNSDGGWGGFLVFVVDMPISLLLAKLSGTLSLNLRMVLLVGGTVWWFCLGILFTMLIRGVSWLNTRFAIWLARGSGGEKRGA